jgi:hypothetical protein
MGIVRFQKFIIIAKRENKDSMDKRTPKKLQDINEFIVLNEKSFWYEREIQSLRNQLDDSKKRIKYQNEVVLRLERKISFQKEHITSLLRKIG